MPVNGFDMDVLAPYYLSRLLSARPKDKDIFHCALHLVCRHDLGDRFLDALRCGLDGCEKRDEVVNAVKSLVLSDPDYSEFVSYSICWNAENRELPFAEIMNISSPSLSRIMNEHYSYCMEKRQEEQGAEKIFRDYFGCSDEEIEIIRFTYFSTSFSYCIFPDREKLKVQMIYSEISEATGIPIQNVAKLLRSDSKLISARIIFFKNTFTASHCDKPELPNNIICFIEGTVDVHTIACRYTHYNDDPVLPLSSFALKKSDSSILQSMLSSEEGFQVLLYGEPGTGKTEYAKSIAESIGKRARFIGSTKIDSEKEIDRLWAIHIALQTADNNDIIVCDEADDILNTERFFDAAKFDKGRLNALFDDLKRQIIWITNDINRMHPSLMRRFAYSIRFDTMKSSQRETIWKHESDRFSLALPEQEIRALSSRYEVNAAGISHASRITALLKDTAADAPSAVLHQVLHAHNELIHGGAKISYPRECISEFKPEFLNTDVPIERIIRAASFSNGSAVVKKGVCSLFYGVPGTGKSESAWFIADELKTRLIMKKYSDLESKWVGETEKNIAAAFQEAEESDAVLFIDEADAFFTARNSSLASWEISRTNEFLAQIDEFKGILICCTNLVDLIDPAMFRRFAFKVNFLPAAKEKRGELYRHFFGRYGELSNEVSTRVELIEGMTPGDLKATATSFMYEEVVSHEQIITAVEKECGFKGKRRGIGF